jgi:hypothetical protein
MTLLSLRMDDWTSVRGLADARRGELVFGGESAQRCGRAGGRLRTSLRRSPLRGDCPALLDPWSHCGTRCVRCAHFARTAAASQFVGARGRARPRALRFSAPPTHAATCPHTPSQHRRCVVAGRTPWRHRGCVVARRTPPRRGRVMAPACMSPWPARSSRQVVSVGGDLRRRRAAQPRGRRALCARTTI